MKSDFAVRMDVLSNGHFGYILSYAAVTERAALDYSHGEFTDFEDLGYVGRFDAGEQDPDLDRADDWAIGLGFDLCKCPKGRGDVPPASAKDVRSAMFAEKAEMIRVRAGCVPGLVVAGPPGLCNKFRPN